MESKEDLRKEALALTAELLKIKSDLSAYASGTRAAVSDAEGTLSEIKTLLGSVKTLDDVIGRRLPKWYTVEIPFSFGDSAPKRGTVEISASPFLCTQIQTLYLITDTDSEHFSPVDEALGVPVFGDVNASGRPLPTTAYYATISTLLHNWTSITYMPPWPFAGVACLGELFSSYGSPVTRFPAWNYPEFDFEISVVGSGRHWTNGKVPAAAFFGGTDPAYLAEDGIVDASDRLEVIAHPVTDTINTAGIVKMVFFGYEIDTEMKLSDIFGY